jgi:hypothetical protein
MKTPTLIPLNWFNRCFWGCLWFNHWWCLGCWE